MSGLLAKAIPLTEPVWQRQAGETDPEWLPFFHFLQHRSTALAAATHGQRHDQVQHTAVRWSWHARVQAWDRSVCDATWAENVAIAREALAKSIQARVAIASDLLDAARNEAAKIKRDSFGTPVASMSPLDVKRISDTARLQLTDILDDASTPGAAQSAPVDYSKLSAEELRQLLELKRKARVG